MTVTPNQPGVGVTGRCHREEGATSGRDGMAAGRESRMEDE